MKPGDRVKNLKGDDTIFTLKYYPSKWGDIHLVGVNKIYNEKDFIVVNAVTTSRVQSIVAKPRADFKLPVTDDFHTTDLNPKTNMRKYHREIKPGTWVDVYDVLKAFEVQNPAIQHALKKLLVAGNRGFKGKTDDLKEAIVSINRAIELEE